MSALWFWLKYGRRCKETLGGRRCLSPVQQHFVFDGQLEHYDGKVWWT